MSRVVCRRGVARGTMSQPFSAADLMDALMENVTECVYLETDAAGRALRGAALCVAARPAPHVAARAAELAAGAGGALRLRVLRDLPPRAELLLWFDEPALAALDMPFLALRNIRGRRDYACHECGAGFEEPNPLKLHLFLSCRPLQPQRFWRRAAQRLAAAAPPAPLPAPPPAPLPAPPSAPLPAPSPALLETLAAEWGRSRDGHACVYCGKLYSRRYGLKIHIRTHTGYRPLRCRHCARAFGDPSNLNKHVRLHAARGRVGGGSQ